MHQKEDAAAFLLPDEVGDAGCDRNGSDTSRADQRIDAAAGQLIHDLGTDHAAAGTEGKRHKAQKDDKYGRGREEGIRSHGRANGDRQDQRNHIEKSIGRCFRQLADDEAFAQEISKHQHGDERRDRRQEHIDDERHDDRECDLLEARHIARLLHHDLSLLLIREKLHDRRLNERHERHIRVRCDRNLRQEMRRQFHRGVDRHRAVCATDDADGSSFAQMESQNLGPNECHKIPK